jgi:hypothetical protein
MPKNANSEINSLIESFTTELQTLVRRTTLEEVLAALGGQVGPRRRGRPPGSGKAMGRGGRRGRRGSENLEQMGATLIAHVKKNPGQRGEQIAKALNTDVGTMRLPMKKLIAARKIKTKGQRRGMTYYAA